MRDQHFEFTAAESLVHVDLGDIQHRLVGFRQLRLEVLDSLKNQVAQVLFDQFAKAPELVGTNGPLLDTGHYRRGVPVLVEGVGHSPVQQQIFVFLERKPGLDLPVHAPPPPHLTLTQQREQQLAEQQLIDVITSESHAVRGHHFEIAAAMTQHAEIEGSAAEIRGQQQLSFDTWRVMQVTDGCGRGFRVEVLLRDTGVLVRLAEPRECCFVAKSVASFEIDRVAEMRPVCVYHDL